MKKVKQKPVSEISLKRSHLNFNIHGATALFLAIFAIDLCLISGPEVLFKTCVAMKFVDDDDDDDDL